MVARPDAIPFTIPEADPIVATIGVLLLHVPPGMEFPNAVAAPRQTCVTPVIVPGEELTVTVAAAAQPVLSVYDMVAVPIPAPVTPPVDGSIAAIVGVLLLHTPPVVPSVKLLVSPRQRPKVPEIGNGTAFTVTGMAV